jgi:hypothetical protein
MWIRLSKGPVAGCCEKGNEHSDSMKEEKYLDQLIVLTS